MSRPKTKQELLHLSQENYRKLLEFVDQLTEVQRQQEFPATMLNRNIRDVLGHLHHWHLLMLNWYTIGMSGEKPAMPAEGYTWRTTSDLNHVIQEKYKDTEMSEIREWLAKSYQNIQDIITSHSDEELFTKKKFKWTGSTSLGAYLISASSSHYDWALKLIKKALK